MGSLKTDSVEFTTRKPLKSLTNDLRQAINATKAQVDQLEDDPLAGDNIQPQVAVLLSGHSLMVGTRMWGVQVYLYDLGDRRVGELVALGEGLVAGGSSSVNAFDVVNERLYSVLVQESRGVNVDDILVLWTELALGAGFESWYIEKFGVREGDVPPTPAEPAPQMSAPAPEKADTAPKAAPSFSVGAGASTAVADKFLPLSDEPKGRKIALISAGVALALTLIIVFGRRAYVTSLLAPALLFVLLMMRKDVDSYLMVIPMTFVAVLNLFSIFNIMKYTSVPAMFFIYFLIDAAIAAAYWLLELKKDLPTNKAAGLLLLLFGIRVLVDLFDLFSAFSYGIFSMMGSLSAIALGVSYFAAIFFAGKHLLGSLKK